MLLNSHRMWIEYSVCYRLERHNINIVRMTDRSVGKSVFMGIYKTAFVKYVIIQLWNICIQVLDDAYSSSHVLCFLSLCFAADHVFTTSSKSNCQLEPCHRSAFVHSINGLEYKYIIYGILYMDIRIKYKFHIYIIMVDRVTIDFTVCIIYTHRKSWYNNCSKQEKKRGFLEATDNWKSKTYIEFWTYDCNGCLVFIFIPFFIVILNVDRLSSRLFAHASVFSVMFNRHCQFHFSLMGIISF